MGSASFSKRPGVSRRVVQGFLSFVAPSLRRSSRESWRRWLLWKGMTVQTDSSWFTRIPVCQSPASCSHPSSDGGQPGRCWQPKQPRCVLSVVITAWLGACGWHRLAAYQWDRAVQRMRPNPVLWGSLVDEWGTRLQVKEAEKVVGALRRDQVSLRDEEESGRASWRR